MQLHTYLLCCITLQDGDNALDVAAKWGNLNVVEFLLNKGANTYTHCKANNVSNV